MSNATNLRTRNNLIMAALAIWSSDPSAPLAKVAAQAGISRASLHRYFASRQDLQLAAARHALDTIDQTADRAARHCLSGKQALRNILKALMPHADAIAYLGTNPPCLALLDLRDQLERQDVEMRELIKLVQKEGALSAQTPVSWLVQMVDALLFVAAQSIKAEQLTQAQAFDLVWRGLRKGYGSD